MSKRLVTSLVVMGLFIGILMAWQFKSEVPTVSNFAVDEVTARDALLKEFLDEQSYFQSRIVSLREDIEEAQEKIESQITYVNLDLLESLKDNIGLSELFGKGMEIILDDGASVEREDKEISDADLVQASDIRDIVNILNASNAKAISVNGQRVISTSPITSVGTTILVNNSHATPPFHITAMGDSDIMLQRLLNEDLLPSIYERVLKDRISMEIVLKDGVRVPVYNGDLKANLLTLVE